MTDALRLVLYSLTSLVLGYSVIALPAAGFIFRDPAWYGITDGQYGLLFLPMVAATIATGFLFQGLVSRFSRHRVFCAGFGLTALYLLLILTASFLPGRPEAVFWLLAAAQTFLGLGFALLMSSVSLFSIELFPNHRTSILTAIHAMFGAGALMSPLVLDLWSRAGWWQGQAVTGIFELAVVGVAALAPASVPRAAAAVDPARSGADAVPGPGVLNPITAFLNLPPRAKGFVAVLVLYGTIEAVIANWSTIYLTRDRGFSPTTAAVCLSLFWGFLTGGRVLATFLAMWIEPRKLFRVAPFIALGGILLLNTVRQEAAVFLPYMIIGLGCSYTFPVSVSLTTRYHEAQRELLPSFMLAGLMTGVGAGSSAIGFFSGMGLFTLEQAFGASAAAAAALCVIFFFLTRKPLAMP
jgi:FHS family glucose/mannose:H+ symporter-like MFS transporter